MECRSLKLGCWNLELGGNTYLKLDVYVMALFNLICIWKLVCVIWI